MRTALRLLLVLAVIKFFFSSSFATIDSTATTTLQVIGTAAELSRETMLEKK